MEADKKRRQFYSIEGTAARELAPVKEPGYMPEIEERPRRRQPNVRHTEERSRRAQHRQERERRQEQRLAPQSAIPAVDFVAMLILVAALGATFMVCVSYLQVQADISSMNKEISRLESATADLVTKNDHTELKIQESVDLAQVQKVAMEELGMVYPYNNQMVTYEVDKSGYVRQYGELIGNEQETVMELLMRMLFSSGIGSGAAGE